MPSDNLPLKSNYQYCVGLDRSYPMYLPALSKTQFNLAFISAYAKRNMK